MTLEALVQRLIDAGTPAPEAAAVVAEAFAAGINAAPRQVDETASRRREKDRERKRNVRRIPQTSADSADICGQPPSSPSSFPPIPPHITTPPSPSVPNGTAFLPSTDEETELFRRGKQILGRQAGGLISKILGAKNKSIPLARAVIETAATKENPREYVVACLRSARDPPEGMRVGWDPRL